MDICWFLSKSKNKKEIKVSKWKDNKKKKSIVINKIKQIIDLFNNSNLINIVDEVPTTNKINYKIRCKIKPIYFSKTWKYDEKENIVCYQFDGKSRGNLKNMTKEDELKVLDEIKNVGFKPIKLGSGMSLKSCNELLSRCRFFVGVDSGMSHMAGCTNTPILFVRNNMRVESWKNNHATKHFILSESPIDLIKEINSMFKYGIDYYNSKKGRPLYE